MPGAISCAAAAVGLLVAVGTWRIGSILRRVRGYRDSAKAAAKAVDGFQLMGASSDRLKELKWFVIDDQVMGGRSSSAILPVHNSIEFAGCINTTGGGFSSCRTLGDDEPLGFPGSANAIEVTAVADARQYKLTLHTADSWTMSVPSWAHDFHASTPGKRQTWRLPLKDFVPSKQGKPVRGATLDPSQITGVGINLSLYNMHGKPNLHFGDGPFKVIIESLSVS